MSLLRSIATIGGLTAVSRVLGFIRDVLTAALLGTGPVADAFFVALRLPNLFRALFAEGAFSAAFVPLFVGTLQSEGRSQARAFAERTLAVLTAALLAFVLVMQLAMGLVIHVIAPGFVGTETYGLAVEFCRLTFPYLLFISLTALLGGVLNAHGRFAAPAATPILLNLSLIGALLGAGPWMPTMGHALAWGTTVAGIVQFLWLFVNTGTGAFWMRLPRPKLEPRVRLLIRRAVPVAFGAGVHQVNVLVDTTLASLLGTGAVSYLFYADRLNQLPHGIVGVAVSTALLPLLSRQFRLGQLEAALHSQNRALELAFLLMLPAAAALMILSEPVIALLFERGAFGPDAVVATANALTAYAAGLPGFLLIKALTPAYYAREDTATPVKIAAITMVVHIALSLTLMWPLGHVGIALSTALAAWCNAGLLAVVLFRRKLLRIDDRLRRRLPRTLLATAAMAAAIWGLREILQPWWMGGLMERAAAVGAMIAVGLAVYGVCVQLFGAARFGELRGLLRGRGAA
jgi:putative peptidoglycan lipid II flippase